MLEKHRLMLYETQFLVEATSTEWFFCWQEWCDHKKAFREDEWKIVNPGLSLRIGELDNRPVMLSIGWDRIMDVLVAHWEICSQVADYQMAENWLAKNCKPCYTNGSRARCDAMNFHILHSFIKYPEKR
jgi:hypothetical protein